MLKLILMAVCVAAAGAVGFLGERFLRPQQAPSPEHAVAAAPKKLLFKLPLGKFTMQILRPSRNIHFVFDLDVYLMGVGAFQEINGAVGRARLRDATVAAIVELAETDQTLAEPMEEEERKAQLAAKIVRKLYVDFPAVRTARITNFKADISLRD